MRIVERALLPTVTMLCVVLGASAFTAEAAPAARPAPFGGDIMYGPRGSAEQAALGGPVTVSNIIYLNDCMPSGCIVSPGFDDSRTNTSSIPFQPSMLPPYNWGESHWNTLVERVREIYAPFNVIITTEDPGTADHFEVMIGGSSTDIGVDGAGGVAPFIPCFGQLQNNVISFVFAETSSDLDYLSGAVAQETAHVFGLDHELDATDAMTYLDLGSPKLFTDNDPQCGEFEPRECWCGQTTQNSYQYLNDLFGGSIPVAPTITIRRPTAGAWVRPGFGIEVNIASQGAPDAVLSVGGTTIAGASSGDVVTANAPLELTSGPVTLSITATSGGLNSTASVTVNVAGACSAGSTCPDGTACLGGFCGPDASVDGGLGAACENGDECLFGYCGTGEFMGEQAQLCTGACDDGNVCPDGFTCLGDGAACWPAADGSGGCSVGGEGAPAAAMLGLLGLMVISRRRRRD